MSRTILVAVLAALFLSAASSSASEDLCEILARQGKDPAIIKICQAAQEADKALERARRYRSLMVQETADTITKANEAVEYGVFYRDSPRHEKPWEHIPSHPSEVNQGRR